MQNLNLFSLYIKILNDNNISYFITGSEDRFNSIIDKYGLTEKYNKFKKRING